MEWISVKERLPKEYIRVLFSTNAGKVDIGQYVHERWFFGGIYQVRSPVTHWMPLPDPPKEADNEID